jgi:hypothetical protein
MMRWPDDQFAHTRQSLMLQGKFSDGDHKCHVDALI